MLSFNLELIAQRYFQMRTKGDILYVFLISLSVELDDIFNISNKKGYFLS